MCLQFKEANDLDSLIACEHKHTNKLIRNKLIQSGILNSSFEKASLIPVLQR